MDAWAQGSSCADSLCQNRCEAKTEDCGPPPAWAPALLGPMPPEYIETRYARDVSAQWSAYWHTKAEAKRYARARDNTAALAACNKTGGHLETLEQHTTSTCELLSDANRPRRHRCKTGGVAHCLRREPNPAFPVWQKRKKDDEVERQAFQRRVESYERCNASNDAKVKRSQVCVARCLQSPLPQCSAQASASDDSEEPVLELRQADKDGDTTRPKTVVSRETAKRIASEGGLAPRGASELAKQQLRAQARTNASLQKMSEMTQNASTRWKLIGAGANVVAVFLGLGLIDLSGIAPSQDALVEGIGTIFLPSLPVVGGSVLALLLNEPVRKNRQKEMSKWLEELRAECERNRLDSCREAVRLNRHISRLGMTGPEQKGAGALRGVGPWLGPALAFSPQIAFLREGVADSDTLGGLSYGSVLRYRFLRVGLASSQRWGDVPESLGGGDKLSSWDLSGGVQLGQGLISPYVERMLRVFIDGAAEDGDSAWVFGNTFDFAGLFSTRGPIFGSLNLDVALLFPDGDAFEPGYRVGVGYGFRNSLPSEEPQRTAKPRPVSYTDRVGLMLSTDNVGVELFRWNGRYPMATRKLGQSASSAQLRPSLVLGALHLDIGVGTAKGCVGASLFPVGKRWTMKRRRIEVGFRTGIAGARHYNCGDGGLFEAEGSATIGFLPTRISARTFLGSLPVEAGIDTSPLWLRIEPSRDELGQLVLDDRGEVSRNLSIWGGNAPFRVFAGLAF